jgi:ribonuclease P protein component
LGAKPRPPARFKKAQRLLVRAEFDRVQTGPGTRKAGAKHFLVLLSPRVAGGAPPVAGVRLGIIASRRVGCAVRRNRAKRLVREWFRHLPSAAGPIAGQQVGPFDMVVVVKSGAETLTLAQVSDELSSALRRLISTQPMPKVQP